jgi:hypothetical protein
MPPNEAPFTGGCQCGAVRFSVAALGGAAICHCRMCQKAFGSFFGPLVTGHTVTWSRGAPAWFQSSNQVRRGFCRDCGTPLAYDSGADTLEMAIGAFDDPTVAAPTRQVNAHGKLAFFDGLTALPVRQPGDAPQVDAFNAAVVSHQHPDHDTAEWPPKQGFTA